MLYLLATAQGQQWDTKKMLNLFLVAFGQINAKRFLVTFG